MDKVDDRNVTLPAEYAEAIDAAVAAGEYGSADAAVGEAVRLWKERRENFGYTIAELRELWREGVESGPSEPAEPFMAEMMGQDAKEVARG